MTIVYKLTDQDNYTRRGHPNETKWGRNVTHTAKGSGGLCSDGVIHAYSSPLLAVLLNPIHAAIENPKLWKAEMEVRYSDKGLKIGGKTLTTVAEIPVPEVTVRQRVIFAVLCAKASFGIVDAPPSAFFLRQDSRAVEAMKRRKAWEDWAEAYMEGKAEALTARAANAAANAANAAYAAHASAHAVEADAARAAYAAAYAANAAAYAYYAAHASAARAADYAANAAAYAVEAASPLDLHNLVARAMDLGKKRSN